MVPFIIFPSQKNSMNVHYLHKHFFLVCVCVWAGGQDVTNYIKIHVLLPVSLYFKGAAACSPPLLYLSASGTNYVGTQGSKPPQKQLFGSRAPPEILVTYQIIFFSWKKIFTRKWTLFFFLCVMYCGHSNNVIKL